MSDRLKRKQSSLPDMDLKVFMNLMVVLIPMLLVSAEFARVSVIDISLPKKRGSTPNEGDKSRARESELLKLTAIITDSALTLGAKEGFLPSIHYKEYHKYITNEDNAELIIPVETGKNADHSTTGRQLHASERSEILLYACNENGEVKQCLYTRFGELLLNAQNEPVTEVKRGDEVYTLTNPKRLVLVKNPDDFVSKPLSVYDELKNRLYSIRTRFGDLPDADNIIIAAENKVAYDKIVQIMDQVREVGFGNVMISKLRA